MGIGAHFPRRGRMSWPAFLVWIVAREAVRALSRRVGL